jgi:nicotinamide riboside kinase
VDLIIIKQNKLPSFIDRWARYEHHDAQRFQSQLERRLWRNQNAFICVLQKEYQYNESSTSKSFSTILKTLKNIYSLLNICSKIPLASIIT